LTSADGEETIPEVLLEFLSFRGTGEELSLERHDVLREKPPVRQRRRRLTVAAIAAGMFPAPPR
jgi:hypothetical protein